MKILHIVGSAKRWSGLEQYIFDVAKGSLTQGHEVLFVVGDDGNALDRYNELGRVFTLNMRHRKNISTLVSLRTIIRIENPDLIHTHYFRTANQALWAMSFMHKVPTINTMHLFNAPNAGSLYKKTFKNTTLVIAVSEAVRQHHLKLFPDTNPEKIVTIINSIDNSRIGTNTLREVAEIPVLGCAGRLTADKGIQILLQAAKILKDKGLKFKVAIAGEGERAYEELLCAYSLSKGLDDIVQWQGFRSDMNNFINSIDIGVVPSVWREPCSLSILEQMAAGKPVVATDTGGQPEVIRSGVDGFIVPGNDAEALAEAIEKMLTTPDLIRQMGESAKNHFDAELNFNQFIEKTLDAYDQTIERTKQQI